MEKNIEVSMLFDFYGQLLSDTVQKCIDFYYNDDLSLSEISQLLGISRQGVRDAINRGENKLAYYEKTLKLYSRFAQTNSALESIQENARYILMCENLPQNAAKYAQDIKDTASRLSQ